LHLSFLPEYTHDTAPQPSQYLESTNQILVKDAGSKNYGRKHEVRGIVADQFQFNARETGILHEAFDFSRRVHLISGGKYVAGIPLQQAIEDPLMKPVRSGHREQ
jgi:hypothetical protein